MADPETLIQPTLIQPSQRKKAKVISQEDKEEEIQEEKQDDKVGDVQSVNRKTSIAWSHFTVIPGVTPARAKCNHCGTTYACQGRNGTTSMRDHIVLNKCRKHRYPLGKNQTSIEKFAVKQSENCHCKHVCLKELKVLVGEMVILDEHKFSMVEGEGFRRLMNRMEPRFIVPCRQTVRRDCMMIHKSEKNKLKLELVGRRICFTTDCWTSIQNLNFMCLTAHYIDDYRSGR